MSGFVGRESNPFTLEHMEFLSVFGIAEWRCLISQLFGEVLLFSDETKN